MSSTFPNRPLNVAVLGASGAVGQELLLLLEERRFPVGELKLLASARSAGQTQTWNGRTLTVEEVSAQSFEGVDLVLASAGGSVSKQWREAITAAGAVMVDNSSAFRMEDGVPLVVPEVNPDAAFAHKGVIANPNCTTILLTLALAPLAAKRAMRRVVVSTYQSASGAGARAMEELKNLSQTVLDGGTPKGEVLPYSLAFNLFFAQLSPAGQQLLRGGDEDGERDPQDHGSAGSALHRHLRAGARAAGPFGSREYRVRVSLPD